MRRYVFPSILLGTALLAPFAAFAADPVGRYTIEGAGPNNGAAYTGTVEVSRTGDTFRVTWLIDGQRYVGTAIGNNQNLAVAYRSGNETGLAVYGENGSNWTGTYAYAGGSQLGTERWTRQ